MAAALASPNAVGPSAWVGARVGALFASLDVISSGWLMRALVGGLYYTPRSPIAFATSIAAHTLLGALLGASLAPLVGVVARRIACTAPQARTRLATLAWMGVLIVNAAASPAASTVEARHVLLLASGFAVALIAASWSPKLDALSGGLVSPWTCATTLVLVPWLENRVLADVSWATRRLTVAVFVLLIGALAMLARRRLRGEVGARATLAVIALGIAGGWLPQATIERERPSAEPRDAPNVVLISLDTLRSDHTSVLGYARDTTPFLREFAKGATVFPNSYSTADFTLPSHASMFTGVYAREHGAHPDPDRAESHPLTRELPTLAERLAAAGWRTVGVVANHGFLGPAFGLQRGFDSYDARARCLPFPKAAHWTLRATMREWLYWRLDSGLFDRVSRSGEEITDEALERLARHRAQHAQEPLFLFVNYMDAHVPYAAGEPMPTYRYYGKRARVCSGREGVTESERAALIERYDEAIGVLDACVARLVGELRRLEPYDDTLIVITSDHGESFGEHATLEHGMSVYSEQVRVPLIVKLPGQRAGEVRAEVTSGVDVAPTVLAHLGLPPLENARGVDVFASLAQPTRTIFAEHYPSAWHVRQAPRIALHQVAAIGGGFQQIRFDDGSLELYDLARDPEQTAPLTALPAGVPDMTKELERWKPQPHARVREPRGVLDALRALGYVE